MRRAVLQTQRVHIGGMARNGQTAAAARHGVERGERVVMDGEGRIARGRRGEGEITDRWSVRRGCSQWYKSVSISRVQPPVCVCVSHSLLPLVYLSACRVRLPRVPLSSLALAGCTTRSDACPSASQHRPTPFERGPARRAGRRRSWEHRRTLITAARRTRVSHERPCWRRGARWSRSIAAIRCLPASSPTPRAPIHRSNTRFRTATMTAS